MVSKCVVQVVSKSSLYAVEDPRVPQPVVPVRSVRELVEHKYLEVGILHKVLDDMMADETAAAGDNAPLAVRGHAERSRERRAVRGALGRGPRIPPPLRRVFFFSWTQLGTARNLRDLLGDACREVADGGDDAVAVGVAQPPSDREADDLIGEHVEVWEESRVLRDA